MNCCNCFVVVLGLIESRAASYRCWVKAVCQVGYVSSFDLLLLMIKTRITEYNDTCELHLKSSNFILIKLFISYVILIIVQLFLGLDGINNGCEVYSM